VAAVARPLATTSGQTVEVNAELHETNHQLLLAFPGRVEHEHQAGDRHHTGKLPAIAGLVLAGTGYLVKPTRDMIQPGTLKVTFHLLPSGRVTGRREFRQ